jgi:hypothetical protein
MFNIRFMNCEIGLNLAQTNQAVIEYQDTNLDDRYVTRISIDKIPRNTTPEVVAAATEPVPNIEQEDVPLHPNITVRQPRVLYASEPVDSVDIMNTGFVADYTQEELDLARIRVGKKSRNIVGMSDLEMVIEMRKYDVTNSKNRTYSKIFNHIQAGGFIGVKFDKSTKDNERTKEKKRVVDEYRRQNFAEGLSIEDVLYELQQNIECRSTQMSAGGGRGICDRTRSSVNESGTHQDYDYVLSKLVATFAPESLPEDDPEYEEIIEWANKAAFEFVTNSSNPRSRTPRNLNKS